MMNIDNSILDSMVGLLETITDQSVDLSVEITNNPDFSNYTKNEPNTELGGHIPLKSTVDNDDYCLNSSFVGSVLESV